jgi:ribosomal-protein-alanine N-acetyltransferase
VTPPIAAPDAWHGAAFGATLEAVLHTPRLLLEPVAARHADEMFAQLSDARLYAHVPQDPPVSLAAVRDRYARLSTRRSPDGGELWLNWVTRDRVDGACRGTLQATVRRDASAYIAYEVLPLFWRQGLGREACARMIAWLIDELGVQRFEAEVDSLNVASLRLLEHLGFERTGWRAAADHFKGRSSDEWTLHLAASDFTRDRAAGAR